MAEMPQALQDIVDDFAFLDRMDRMQLLLEYADRFEEVPPEVAERPFDEEHHVERCESQAYVWEVPRDDGTLKYYFAVENPQGISARAWAVILDETLSGQPPDQVLATPADVLFKLFGNDMSMGKGEGLMGMLGKLQYFTRRRLKAS